MGGETKGTTREERVARAIERNKREAEERELQRQERLKEQREAIKLQSDKENGIINYLIENGKDMEMDKLFTLDILGEEVTIQTGMVEDTRRYRVSFENKREVVDYDLTVQEDGEVNVVEVKDSRLSVRKQKQAEQMMAMMQAMSSTLPPKIAEAYERGIYGR